MAITLPSVVEAKHDGRFRVRLVFEDTTTKTLYFRPWLKGPVFAPLKDVKYFSGSSLMAEPSTGPTAPILPRRPSTRPRTSAR